MNTSNAEVQLHQDRLVVSLSGNWRVAEGLRSIQPVTDALSQSTTIECVEYESSALEQWDSSLIVFLQQISQHCQQLSITNDRSGLTSGINQLIDLAGAVPKLNRSSQPQAAMPVTERFGNALIRAYDAVMDFLTFWGEALLACMRFARGKAIYRRADLVGFVRDAGPAALGIVSLISVLVGTIIAFIGVVQLEKFSAGIYISSMIGFAIPREMAAMMTAIIMSGRTGAAYAAQLGSMQVNEEIDALTTMGVSPFDFLVLPRMLALIIMMPLLTIYANVLGILSGALTSVAMLDITLVMFWDTMIETVSFRHVWIGLFKSFLFGILVALAGCYMGMKCGRSATAVGQVTTQSVVLGIVLIIVFDSIINFIGTVLNY